MARVRVENEFHDFYRTLAFDDDASSRGKTFSTMKDVFMLAFAFGAARELRTALGPSRDIFADTTLRGQDWDVIKAVALAENEKSLGQIESSDELIRVAEEYANTGVRILKSEFLASAPVDSIASALLQQYADNTMSKDKPNKAE